MLLRRSRPENEQKNLYLGRTDSGSIVHMPPPVFQGKQGSDTYIIVGMTGSGKSMITRLLIDQICRTRPVWIFDGKGRDHYLGYYPNRSAHNLPPGITPRGIPGFYFYYEIKDETGMPKSRPKMPYELDIKPNFSKYSYEQLEAMGFTGAAPKNLKDIMQKFKPFRSLRVLQDFIEKYPTDDRSSKTKAGKGTRASMHSKAYRDGDFIRSDSLNALIRDFRIKVMVKDVWSMSKTSDVSIEKLFLSGKNAVFSFNDVVLARAETDYTLKEIIKLTDKYPDVIRPMIFVEEAHEMFEDETLVDFVRTSRKQGVGMANTLPTLEPFNKKETSDVPSDTKQWITGKLRGFNKVLAMRFIDHQATYLIPRLRLDRHLGIREFLYFNGDKDEAYGPFQAFECPQEYNRQI